MSSNKWFFSSRQKNTNNSVINPTVFSLVSMFMLMFLLPQCGDVLRRFVYERLPGSHREWRASDLGVRRQVLHRLWTRPHLLPIRQTNLSLYYRELGVPHQTGEWRLPYPTKQVSEDYPTPPNRWVKVTLPHQTGEWRLSHPTKQVSEDYPTPPNRWVKISLPHQTGEWRLIKQVSEDFPTPPNRWVEITLPTKQVNEDYPTPQTGK